MRTINTWRDPYENGYSPTKPTKVTFNPGVTVLVGCNGAGKTTMLRNLAEKLNNKHVPYITYDNLKNGGSNSIGEAFFYGKDSLGATLWCSSEGESIIINIGQFATKLSRFIHTGLSKSTSEIIYKHRMLNNIPIDEADPEYRKERWFRRMFDSEKERNDKRFQNIPDIDAIPKERWLLFDAVDSGLSIDNIVQFKNMFKLIFEDSKKADVETYIIVVANGFEMANGEQCFDVQHGKYLTFPTYEDYKKFILKSSQIKEKWIKEGETKKALQIN